MLPHSPLPRISLWLCLPNAVEVRPHAPDKLCCLALLHFKGPSDFPYARNVLLAGFTQLDARLPPVETGGNAGISSPTSIIFHHMPMAIPRVPYQCSCPLRRVGSTPHASLSLQALAFPSNEKGQRVSPISRSLSLSQTLPAFSVWLNLTRLHHSLYASACGFGRHP